MTVIAWDGNQLAADSALTASDGTINRMVKVAAIQPRGPIPHIGEHALVLFGVAGDPGTFAKVAEFLGGETTKLQLKDSRVIIAVPGQAWIWEGDRPAKLIDGAKAAIGSGAQGALVAMLAGITAAKAVELVCAADSACREPVQALHFMVQEPEAEVELHERQPEPDSGGTDGTT